LAQLTWRESLRDIEDCLRTHKRKFYHLGIRDNGPDVSEIVIEPT
jgi:hypothetical protein